MKLLTLTTAFLAASTSLSAFAQDLPKTELHVVGGLSNLTAYQQFDSRSGKRRSRRSPAAR